MHIEDWEWNARVLFTGNLIRDGGCMIVGMSDLWSLWSPGGVRDNSRNLEFVEKAESYIAILVGDQNVPYLPHPRNVSNQ